MNKKQYHPFYYLIFFILALNIVLNMLSSYMDITDGYFILSTGKYILNNGIPVNNPFFVLDGYKLIIQQWLWTVFNYFIYEHAGYIGLFFFVLIITFILFYTFYKTIVYIGMDKYIAIFLILLFLNLSIESIRPEMITYILCLLQILLIEKYIQTKKYYYLFGMLPIAVAEINLHGTLWIIHILILISFIFPNIFKKYNVFKERSYQIKPLVISMIAIVLFSLINPYGYKMLILLKTGYSDKMRQLGISELQNSTILNPISCLIITFLIFLGIIISHNLKLEIHYFYLCCGLIILGANNQRSLLFSLMGIIILLSSILKNKDFSDFHIFVNKQSKSLYIVGLIVILLSFSDFNINKSIFKESDDFGIPVSAINYLDTVADKEAKVFTSFNSGSYIDFRGYKIYIESRTEGYFKKVNMIDDTFDEFFDLCLACTPELYNKFVNKYDFDYLCIEDYSSLLGYAINDSNYELIYSDDNYYLFQKRG